MPRADAHIPITGEGDGANCPSLVDLAAYAGGGLGEEENERIEAHVARCAVCLALLEGLRAEVADIDDEARLLLMPTTVLEAAMGLRAGDARVAPRGADPSPALLPWLIFARRGAALAACAALAIAGFAIGDSFAAASSAGDTSLVAATDGLDFGLLTDVVIDPSDDESLFSLAQVEGSAEKAKEATP